MGLDQYAYILEKGQSLKDAQQHTYWRKHARLQEFMQKKYYQKTKNTSEDGFNCEPLYLDENDLLEWKKQIENAYQDNVSEGKFFWGHEYQEESVLEYRADDLNFVNEALKAIKQGKQIVYSCWY